MQMKFALLLPFACLFAFSLFNGANGAGHEVSCSKPGFSMLKHWKGSSYDDAHTGVLLVYLQQKIPKIYSIFQSAQANVRGKKCLLTRHFCFVPNLAFHFSPLCYAKPQILLLRCDDKQWHQRTPLGIVLWVLFLPSLSLLLNQTEIGSTAFACTEGRVWVDFLSYVTSTGE